MSKQVQDKGKNQVASSTGNISLTDKNMHHSIACKSCRHLHLYCDKTLPSCSECSHRGKTCCYEKPKKRGRPIVNKSSSTGKDVNSSGSDSGSSSSPSNSSSSEGNKIEKKLFKFQLTDEGYEKSYGKNTEMKRYHPYFDNLRKYGKRDLLGIDDDLIRNNCKLETIDFFYQVVDPGFDLVSMRDMKHLLNELNDESKEANEFLAMMYSIQALCEQRLANTKRSEMAAQESRKYLTKSNYNLYSKIGYAVLSDYFAGDGQDDVAQSYLAHLKRISGDLPQSFKYLIVKAERTCEICDREWSGVISSIVFIYSIYNRDKTSSYDPDLKSIEEGVNPQNAEIALLFVEKVKGIMEAIHSKTPKGKYSEDYSKMKLSFQEIVFLSGVSSVFFSIGLEGEIVDAMVDKADQIIGSFDAQMSPVAIFPHLSVYMSYRVKRFGYILAEFQFHIMNGMDIRSIFCLEKFQKYFSGIVQYIKVMTEFSKRYNRIKKHFAQLFQNLLAIAKWKFDVQSQIIPNALVEDTNFENVPETPKTPQVPIVSVSSPILTNVSKDSTFLSCLEKAKLNQTFSI